MSVKGKVKRANRKIEDLKKKIQELEQLNREYKFITIKAEDEDLKIIKDNFIKMILNQRKPLEDQWCRFSISRAQLDMMKSAKLEVKRNYIFGDNVDFILKI